MVLDPIPQILPVHFFGSRPQPPTSRHDALFKCTQKCGTLEFSIPWDMTYSYAWRDLFAYSYVWHDWLIHVCDVPLYSNIRRSAAHFNSTLIALRLAMCPRCVAVYCGGLRCVAVSCSVVQCGAVWCSVCCNVLQCVAVYCSLLQCVAVWCSVVQCGAVWCCVVLCVAVCCSVKQCGAVYCSVLQCVAVSCSVLQCIAACYSVLQHVAACCNVLVTYVLQGHQDPHHVLSCRKWHFLHKSLIYR